MFWKFWPDHFTFLNLSWVSKQKHDQRPYPVCYFKVRNQKTVVTFWMVVESGFSFLSSGLFLKSTKCFYKNKSKIKLFKVRQDIQFRALTGWFLLTAPLAEAPSLLPRAPSEVALAVVCETQNSHIHACVGFVLLVICSLLAPRPHWNAQCN